MGFREEIEDAPWTHLFQEIDHLVPQQPPLDIRFNDASRLADSIRKMKSHKAIGADGWHAEELQALTPTMLDDLARLFEATWTHGLTSNLMQARTLLFAKCDKPKAINDGRPITILGYIARTTSKMISDQILQEWSNRWPPAISGGLPRRSARDLSILQLSQIEESKISRTAWGGWTMDLVKAFNLIPRRVIRYLFLRLGVPSAACNFWFLSLSRMTRALQSGKSLGEAHGATTGLPEGDSMSVVGMLALSYLYYQRIRTPKLHPYTYADNWSFMSMDQRDCMQAMIKIFNLVHSLKMRIDFTKSWCWATTKQFQEFWKSTSVLLMDPTFQFTIKSHVHDLGCMLQYSNRIVLGPLRDKIDNAIARCNRLKRLPLNIDEKGEKIQTAIWPYLFYGTLGMPLGDKHFKALRRAATNVLVGDFKHASSHIAMQYLTPRVQDPELYVINDLITTLRRLLSYYPALANTFVQRIITFDGMVTGPATTIAYYLKN